MVGLGEAIASVSVIVSMYVFITVLKINIDRGSPWNTPMSMLNMSVVYSDVITQPRRSV